YTPLHHLLFRYPVTGTRKGRSRLSALVMTSGNLSEEPIVVDNDEAMKRLSGMADAFLLHDRDIFMRVDDSVVAFPDAGLAAVAEPGRRAPSFVRRSRGFVPEALLLADSGPEVLGCGADIKNTFTITKEDCAIVSQHIGDMENFETVSFFEETLANLKHVYRCRPVALAHDLHPDYLTTHWAVRRGRETGLQSHAVQHHHAHIASVMAEHALRGPVIGVALDGTGYGIDGNLWGSEFMVCDLRGFSRVAHFRYVALPGGERAIKEGWRTAVSLLADAVSEPSGCVSSACSGCRPKLWEALESIGFVAKYGRPVLENLLKIRGNRQFSPLSCGAGRLFDAASAIAGVCERNTFEGEAAIALESVLQGGDDRSYPFVLHGEERMEVDFSPMLREVVKEVAAGTATSLISYRFHNTMVDVVDRVVHAIRVKTGVRTVGLSGGVFQNAYLLGQVRSRLSASGFDVYVHEKVPCNDACISLGQAVVLREKLRLSVDQPKSFTRC
ncbi:MAG TPA: Sua5/YciO/YrdC/YwlC family protein, partial [Dissulfurispiraceae bacterium]|nr:Sua5/YciO/YrdC/YwlC family protein [Dissulfurispiraceae bacterium]